MDRKILERSKSLLSRRVEPVLRDSLFGRGISVLLGARQVGKTSLLMRLVRYLSEEKKVPLSQIEYLDLEYPHLLSEIDGIYGEEFLRFLGARGVDTEKQCYVFIDEIHYLENPSSFLKTLYDHFPNIKLVVSGSSTLQIKHKFKDALTGRKRIFEITPLNFEEFLLFKGSELLKRKRGLNLRRIISEGTLPELGELKYLRKDFTTLFEEYAIFGGYPEVVLLEKEREKQDLLAEIYSSYVRKDIKDFAQIGNVRAFNNLIELLGYQIGNLINISELTSSVGISRNTTENYLSLMENTFLISLISPYFTNRRQEIIKSPKVFFWDSGLRSSLVRNFEHLERRGDRGAIFENVVFEELQKNRQNLETIHYWRTKTKQVHLGAETDFILRGKEVLPIEVKWGELRGSGIPSGLYSFIKTYNPVNAIIVTRDTFGKEKRNNTTVFSLPAWLL